MRRSGILWTAVGGIASLFIGGNANAQAGADERPTVYPGVREFRWTFGVPSLTLDQREAVVEVPTLVTRARRWDYQAADFGTQRRSLGKIPEFSCKYPDLMLPNECRTVWRDVYVDSPVLVERHQHIDLDVPEWRWQKQLFPIVLPRWTWSERPLTVSVPVVTDKP